MKYVCFIALLCAVLIANAEARYKVESLSITGAQNYRLSKELLQQIQGLIGQTLNPEALDSVVQGIGNEVGGQPVSKKVVPGNDPEHVKVVVEVGSAKDEPPADTGEAATEVNVNSRYTVEDIQIKGVRANRLSEEVNEQLHQLVGQKFNQGALDDLMQRIKKELHARSVSQTLSRGAKPEHIKVVLDVVARKEDETDFHLSKYVYQSKQAWSAKAFGEFDIASKTSVLVGLVSDSDELLERFAGLAAGFESRKVATDRVRLRFLFETYHNQWNASTLQALEASPDVPGIYRNRKSFQPVATFVIARPLKVSAGTSFELFQTQYPVAHMQAANSAIAGLRYDQSFEDSEGNKHEIRGGYDLRAANRTLDSDFVYTRHLWNLGYKIAGPKQAVVANFTAGSLRGRAPLFERYTLGNTTTLRGWNKFDVAPLGGDRMVHNTLEYRHAIDDDGDDSGNWIVFYDVGAVWNRGQDIEAKHSVGFGARWKRFFAALAFPVKTGRMAPVFMVGAFFTEGASF